MRKIAWIVFCVVVCSGLVFSQSITVTRPSANEVLYKGESYTITWTISGPMPGEVRIALVNEAANAIVMDIAQNTINDGRHPWPIPINAPGGRYKIAIRAVGTKITGVSPAFNIQMRRAGTRTPPPPEQRRVDYNVTIIKPDSNSRWNFGETKDIMIETDFEAHYFWMDLTSGEQRVFPIQEGAIQPFGKDGDIHKYRYRWTIPTQSADKGYYRVRVKATSTQGEVEGLSASFYLSEDVTLKTSEIMFQPTSLRNRFYRKQEDYEWQWEVLDRVPEPRAEHRNRPGLLRIGFENNYTPPQGGSLSWRYYGFIFRSHIAFSFAEIKDKIRMPLEAALILRKKDSSAYSTQLAHGAGKLYVMTAPWDGRAIDTPGYFYKDIPQTPAPLIEIDVLQQVKDWLSEAEENMGFLIVGAKEDFGHNDEYMVTFFNAELKVRYLEEQ